MSLALRQPLPADFETIASWVPDAVTCHRWAGPRVKFPFTARSLPSMLAVTGGISYCLAEGDETPSAFGQHWVQKPGAVHLGRIIVAPGLRGQGVGRVLCQQLMERAVDTTGASAVTLRVYRDNTAAVKLYASLGFVPVEPESDRSVAFMYAEA